uniref:Riboflavin transporter n=1 Tax=Lynx canadensis TaxID=61383 RepID=A0A667FZV8_LYNCA
ETLYLPAQPCLPVHLLLVILSTGSWAALTGTCAKLPVMVEDLLGCWSLPFSLCVPVVLWNLDGLGVTLWRPVDHQKCRPGPINRNSAHPPPPPPRPASQMVF